MLLLGWIELAIWYWVNLIKIEKERHLASSHVVNHICRGQYQHASLSVRYADLCAFFPSIIYQGPIGILFLPLSTLPLFLFGPSLVPDHCFFSGLKLEHMTCFQELQVLCWAHSRYPIVQNLNVTTRNPIYSDIPFFRVKGGTTTWPHKLPKLIRHLYSKPAHSHVVN
jgi:hypothetical protein